MKWALVACALSCAPTYVHAASNPDAVWNTTSDTHNRTCTLSSVQSGNHVSYLYTTDAPLGILKIQNPNWNFTDGGMYRFRVVRTFSNDASTTQNALFELAYGADYIRSSDASFLLLTHAGILERGINPEKIILDFEGGGDVVIDVSILQEAFPAYIQCVAQFSGQNANTVKTLSNAILGPVESVGDMSQRIPVQPE